MCKCLKCCIANNPIECKICYGEYHPSDFITLGCDHMYCKTCLQYILKVKIEEKNVNKIICPCDECDVEISFLIIKYIILTKEMFEKYDLALLNSTLISDKECIFCPVPDCGNPIYGDKNSPKIICRKCDQKICYNCKTVGWHKGDCDIEERKDDGVAEWMKKTGSKPCPKCSVPIEKNNGCDHIYCINCKHHFYWSKPKTKYKGTKYIPLTETQWNEKAAEWNQQNPDAINNPWNIAPIQLPNLHWGEDIQRLNNRLVNFQEELDNARQIAMNDLHERREQQNRIAMNNLREHREQRNYQMYGVNGGQITNDGIYCIYCNQHYRGWKKHCETKKHQRNAAENGNNN